jgi:hypothetical protein
MCNSGPPYLNVYKHRDVDKHGEQRHGRDVHRQVLPARGDSQVDPGASVIISKIV